MVFQSALSYVLNKYLGEFVENLDEKQLNVGIWGGDIELKDLVIKPAALDELDLPVQCVFGKLGKLVLKIPWKSLYTERTVITIEDVYLLVHPNQQVKFDPIKEELKKLEYKRKEIERIEELKKITAEKLSGKTPAKQGWTAEFAEKLVTTVIKNLQLTIKHIHVRYEDRITNPKAPFAFGITLDELSVESTDENWQKVLSEDLVKIYKILYLENLGVYLNCNAKMCADLPTSYMIDELRNGIASTQKTPEGFTYVLGPINASARLKMNQKPELDEPEYSIPKFHLNLQMEELYIGLNRNQYQNIISLVDSIERMNRGLPFRKFRPNINTYKGHYREWWHFAINSVLEYEVRRKRREWDWNHIKDYRSMCKEYKELYYRKLNKKLKENERFDECEKLLDLTNLIIIREQVLVEGRREAANDEKKGWLGWIWGGSNQSKEKLNQDSALALLKQEMTAEEKTHLYQAIDYQENAAPVIYPENYIDLVATFLLKKFTIELSDITKTYEAVRVFKCELNSVKCRLEKIPAGQGLTVKVKIDDFTGTGYEEVDYVPYLITSESNGGGLLDILYEMNPIDKNCDQRIHVIARSLRIVYDAETINRLVNVFTIPPDSSVSQLQDAATNRITEFKEMSSLGLQFALEKHQVLDINIDLQAPYLIMPYSGRYMGEENVIVVDLGKLRIYSTEKTKGADVRKQFESGKNQSEILEYMQENVYDKFKLELTNLQILVAQSEEDWKKTLNEHIISDMHLLQPLSLEICYSKCVISDDPRLPQNKIEGVLPFLNLVVSDARLMLAMSLINSVPFPKGGEPEIEPLKSYPSTSSLHSLFKEVRASEALALIQEPTKERESVDQLEFKLLVATFIISEINLTVKKQESISREAENMANFRINSFCCELKKLTFATLVTINLANVGLEAINGEGKMVNIIETKTVETLKDLLFRIVYTQVDPKCPDIHSVYKSCENHLSVEFGSLNVTLHKESILCLLQFYSDLNDYLVTTAEDKRKSLHISGGLRRAISTASSLNIMDDPRLKRSKRKKKLVNETIKFKLSAYLGMVTVNFTEDAKDISIISIGNFNLVFISKETYQQINAALGNLSVRDLNKQSIHHEILSGLDTDALSAQVVVNTIDKEETSDLPNIEVKLQLGRMRILFLNWFVTNMLNYMNQFQVAQQAIINASAAAAEVTKNNVKGAYEKAQKVALNINLKAPLIIVPLHSKSYNVLYLDLGVLTMKNKFLTLDILNDLKIPAIVDELTIALNELKISRASVDENYNMVEEHIILEPSNLQIEVRRNLSTSWYTSIPDMDVSGKIKKVQIIISNVDYQGVMHILNGNLTEGVLEEIINQEALERTASEVAPAVNTFVDLDKAEVAKEIWADSIKVKPHISLKFTFQMDQFIIKIYNKPGATIKTDLVRSPDIEFAKFALEGLSVKGRILTDNSLVTSVLLLKCTLDDIRPNRSNKLNRIIERSPEQNENTPELKSMIDVTFQKKNDDTFNCFLIPEEQNISHLVKVADTSTTTKTVKQQVSAKPPVPKGTMTLNLKLEKPDIMLVEHMDHIDARAVVFNAEILLKFRQSGTHQVINGVIKDCELYRTIFNPERRLSSKITILSPIEISLAGSTPPEQGLHLELLVTNVYINISQETVELMNQVMLELSSETKTTEDEKVFQYIDLWNPKTIKDDDYWFLNTEVGGDVLDLIQEHKELEKHLEELCIISVPLISLTIEVGTGNKALPMLIIETGFRGNVRNWTNNLTAEVSLTMQMGYYNNKLAMWEPLIEPEVISEHTYVPWELKVDVAMNESVENLSSTTFSVAPSEFDPENELDIPKPALSIGVFSEKTLELTVSKTFLEMIEYLQKVFNPALDPVSIKEKKEIEAPFKIVNDLGEDITLKLEDSSFTTLDDTINATNNTDVPLQLKERYKNDMQLSLAKELAGMTKDKSYSLKIQINALDSTLILPVERADKRYFSLNYRTPVHENWGIISDVTVVEAVTTILLRSIIQVHNHFDVPIDVYFMTPKGNELELINQIKPNSKLNIPLKAVYTPTTELFFGLTDYSVTAKPFVWKSLQTNLKTTKVLKCFPKNHEKENVPFIIEAVGEMEQVYYEQTNRHTMTSTCYNIHLKPSVSFMNSLPLPVVCCVDESPEEYPVEPGDTWQLPTVEPGNNYLVIRIPQYLEKEWSCRKQVVQEPEEFSVWSFESYDSATKLILDLGMHSQNIKGSLKLTLYCPFWMINKTGLMLSYRSSEDNVNVLYHPASFEGPILFSFAAKNFFGKKKASIRIENGKWSDKFSIDVAGSSGVITCRHEELKYEVGVQNKLTYNGLTKQITFVPYYVIINEAPFTIECQENSRPADPWILVEPKSCSPLWPKDDSQDKLMKMRVHGTNENSAPFLYTESHTTLLKLDNKFGGLNVDIQITEGAILINVAAYEDGSAPALLVNHSSYPISYWEKESIQKRTLDPSQSVLYTWENPSGPRELVWDRGHRKEIIEDLRKDKYGEFSPADGVHIFWTSFLDGMQRVLLFTQERYLAENAQASNILEQIQQEISVNIHGIGLSLVNNTCKQELMYVGLASSGVIWEYSKLTNDKYKYLDHRLSNLLELAYQQCLKESLTNVKTNWLVKIDSKTEVDFKAGRMFKPTKRKIRRNFLPGLWLNMKTSPSQMQIHAKVNRLQIDNQLYDCIFPVVLAPVPPPKSVASESMKPFIEVSIVQLLLKNSQIRQFKYFKVLVQEFHIKMDIGFVNALVEMLTESEVTTEKSKQLFLLDKENVGQNLYKLAASQSIQQQKSFYDLLHFSPLKIHISFSLASTSSSENSSTPPILNVLLQGLGVTLTDVNDVVFKLAFFERNFNFLTQNQLISEATNHYIGQFIKQFYVLILGLDVLGNPYGLVIGITKGVEDLFYEPFQGAIQGPGEFVEGLSLGVKSLFGHTVGGAAGAVSKITGAMGKGIAALTFDDEYQRKRREQKNRKPQNAQEGLARSGKGVVMGIYSGVTGVFTKPVEGAKEEGVEGFFKGLGKGAMGLVTRPVAGVVDFASESLDVVKRAAEGHEDAVRLRAPRFLRNDGLVRPYNKREALGNKYLYSISKGKYSKTDIYVVHYDVIENREVLLLTDHRIAYITHSDMFGTWQIEWQYTWDEITMPAKVSPRGVLIQSAEKKKKVFGTGEQARMILISNAKLREEICEKIESLRTV